MTRLSTAELNGLVAEATVDAHDDEEQLMGFYTMLQDNLATPFQTTVLGAPVTAEDIDLRPGSGLVVLCTRGAHQQAIGILDLPLPDPRPDGAEWIDAYRHWNRNR